MITHVIEQKTSGSGSSLSTSCLTCGKRIERTTGCNAAGMAYSRCGHAAKWLEHIGIKLEPYPSNGYFQLRTSFRVRSPEGKILGHVGRRDGSQFGGDVGYRTLAGKWVAVRFASEHFAAFQLIYRLGYSDMPAQVSQEIAQ